jgi:hypothetical protein
MTANQTPDAGSPAAAPVRTIDRVRATRMIIAQLTGDAEMFATAAGEAYTDPYGNGTSALVNVLRAMSEDIAGSLTDIHGPEKAVHLTRQLLLAQLEQGDPQ